jgi:predicted nuclease of predicted toxin-antitoxin system
LRLLLDESVPRRLGRHLAAHDVESVHDREWDGLKNGALLSAAEAEYDVLITADQNLPHQQHLPLFKLRIVVLAGATNRLEDLVPLVPSLLQRCEELQDGQVAVVSWRV